MNSEPAPTPSAAPRRSSVFRNWLSLTGLVVVVGSLFSVLLAAAAGCAGPLLQSLRRHPDLPGGAGVPGSGAVAGRRWAPSCAGARSSRPSGPLPPLRIDLTRPRDRRLLGFFLAGSVLFLLISALGSYQTYHFTESVHFCGQACHGVMKPEYVTYLQSARMPGSPAPNAISARAPVGTSGPSCPAPTRSMPPWPTSIRARSPRRSRTCARPRKPASNATGRRSSSATSSAPTHYFLGDETNTPFTVRMLMKVGGGDPTHGPVGGIHWHMNVGNKIEYLATRRKRARRFPGCA